MTLEAYGWDPFFAEPFSALAGEGFEPGRVVCELRRNLYGVQAASGEILAECGGGFFHRARKPDQFPAIGDWVAIRVRADGSRADLQAVLPRRTKFSRRAAGTGGQEQIIAANVDMVILVSGLDQNFNPRRIERFLVAVKESGAEAVIALNKADLLEDFETARREVESIAPGTTIFVTSTLTRRGLKALAERCARPGRTLAFVGSSGVGKSSLVNALLRDDAMPVGEVREKDGKGRHVTTRRELVATPSGALLIDTPGMRELQLWGGESGLEDAFADIHALALKCRFSTCHHRSEPGCAVLAAVQEGSLPAERLESYQKLKSETLAHRPPLRKPSALASKPGWRKKEDERSVKGEW